jgi:CMP-N-acetylneuraminic acid synthetase
MRILAIIPARGGSARIPGKNIKKLADKPLIAWAILGAKKSKLLDRVVVSTDSPEIAKVAKKYGAETPFLRPESLATPTIGIEPVLKHAYEWFVKNENYAADLIVLLMSTNPLRRTFHIDEAIKLMKKSGADSVVTVNETPANHTPYWTLVRAPSGRVSLFGGKSIKKIITRSQDFPHKCYARNDLVYVLKPKNLYEDPSNLYGDKVELYDTGPEFEADINTGAEWDDAVLKFKRLIKRR